jgi:hypothetical protein
VRSPGAGPDLVRAVGPTWPLVRLRSGTAGLMRRSPVVVDHLRDRIRALTALSR